MANYGVYQFTQTKETCVLPTSWVIDGEVKYDSRKASDYAKKGKMPYKKWRTYKVELICAKLFDSYETAYRAESILLEKSDLESTDIEAINRPTPILNKKRQRNKLVLPDAFTDGEKSDLSSSDNENIEMKLPPLKDATTKRDLNCMTNTVNSKEAELGDNLKIREVPILEESQIFETSLNNDMNFSLVTESQINELKELIKGQHALIQAQNEKIDNLTVIITNMSTQLQNLNKQADKNTNDNMTIVTRWAFPLKTIDDVKDLEESLKKDENGSVKEFKSYLLHLGGETLKIAIKWIIKEIYSLELQQHMNYSGRENKFPTKNLIQTKIILEVLQLNSKKTQVEAINEYMYHMQHVTDRIRAVSKKTL
ncbi:unnamed protein product [Callosobruchus maculatus]|uniref:DUF4806 domain-containing protein n=1 Tax=Callosobruchus maculatus TaxID=64391 RepID=A0A653DBM6_CALMS|nr:unnamed protein product [Callosobruchus maculatus]